MPARKDPADRVRSCVRHRQGVEPGTPPFFVPGCPRCEENKAAGKVRGDEGVTRKPRRFIDHTKRKPMPQFVAIWAKRGG